jgi:hypothetical protein
MVAKRKSSSHRKKPDFKVKRSGNRIIVSATASVLGSTINKWNLHDNDTVNLTFKIEIDASALAKIIEKKGPPPTNKPRSSWAKKLAIAVVTAGCKEAITKIIDVVSTAGPPS